jgi:hypothetical protein
MILVSKEADIKEGLLDLMVVDIFTEAQRLDPMCLNLFLGWLNTRLKPNLIQKKFDEASFKLALLFYFESLSVQNVLWEYRIIMEEIEWWHDLDLQRLNFLIGRSETRRYED